MNENQIESLIDQARSALEEDKTLLAIQFYRRALSFKADSTAVYLELASVYAELLRFDAAIALLVNALKVLPGQTKIILALAEYHLRIGSFYHALHWFQQLDEKNLAHARWGKGMAFLGQNEFVSAEYEFRLAMRLNPKFPKIHGLLGEVLLKKNEILEAIRHLRHECLREPYDSESHRLLGIGYGKLNQWYKAYNEFTLAVDLDPDNVENWRWCGEALFSLRRYSESGHYARRSLEICPESKESLSLLKKLESHQGGAPAMRTDFKTGGNDHPSKDRVNRY